MTASGFVVTLDPQSGAYVRGGVQGAVVWANTSADAKAILKAQFGDDMDSSWDNATYTAMARGADLAGWSMRCQVINVSNVVKADVTVVGAAAATVDTIAALMATALSAITATTNAAYNSSTNVFTAAGTADALGDGRLIVEFWPPVGATGKKVTIPGFVGAITQAGSNGAALTVQLATDAYTVPGLAMKFASKEY